jgi:3-methylcrotonyl-CoA carboxylase alpha subunit
VLEDRLFCLVDLNDSKYPRLETRKVKLTPNASAKIIHRILKRFVCSFYLSKEQERVPVSLLIYTYCVTFFLENHFDREINQKQNLFFSDCEMLRYTASKAGNALAKQQKNSLRALSVSSYDRPFDKVLIANRGEIACRVIRTCQQLQIPTVALYSDADGPNCLHAQMADEAYLIGTGPHPSASYLLQDEILDIAQATGAQAIHPGYGFLSENFQFCQRVSNTPGMAFVGPPPPAIQAMGSKSQSKAIMEQAGVPTTPGYYGDETQEAEFLIARAREIGFPMLIKAVMGGGGKGMRIVWKESEFISSLQACQRESLNSFGDDRVLLEKYLLNPRHVEVQVVADSHGNVVHLFERDCSLQRRHQKIIEEAPASDLDPELREQFGEMGKRAAQAVGYVNAGTVEFLLEGDNFYFCEMNTRLQVEHPITELVTGVDLVEWQLRIAAGEPLPVLDQSEIKSCGHALEARIYAENPDRNFMPAVGTVWHHSPPAISNSGINDDGVRVDTGIQPGQEVGVYYDPMICKLIVHDENREKALVKLVKALKSYQIAGVPTNIDFLIACAQHETFQKAGAINTGFLDDHLEDVLKASSSSQESSPLATAVGVFATLLHMEHRIGIPITQLTQARQSQSPWSSLSGSWRMGGQAKRTLTLEDGRTVECMCHRDGSYDICVDGNTFHIQGTFSVNGGPMQVLVDHSKRIQMTTAFREGNDGYYQIRMWPSSHGLGERDYFWQVDVLNPMIPSSSMGTGASTAGHGAITAPMPGKVSRILVSEGDLVTEGDVLLVMEAMKMEHTIVAPGSGVLKSLNCRVDEVVQDGAILAEVEESMEGEAIDSPQAV